MTAKQPFRGEKFACKKPFTADPKTTPVVIQLSRKFSIIPDAANSDQSLSRDLEPDKRDDLSLPLFPGQSWFGG